MYKYIFGVKRNFWVNCMLQQRLGFLSKRVHLFNSVCVCCVAGQLEFGRCSLTKLITLQCDCALLSGGMCVDEEVGGLWGFVMVDVGHSMYAVRVYATCFRDNPIKILLNCICLNLR